MYRFTGQINISTATYSHCVWEREKWDRERERESGRDREKKGDRDRAGQIHCTLQKCCPTDSVLQEASPVCDWSALGQDEDAIDGTGICRLERAHVSVYNLYFWLEMGADLECFCELSITVCSLLAPGLQCFFLSYSLNGSSYAPWLIELLSEITYSVGYFTVSLQVKYIF